MTYQETNPRIASIYQAMQSAYDELMMLVEGPLKQLESSRLYEAPAPDSWTIMENLAHIVEFMPYWAGEIAQLAVASGQPFGRTQQHEGRLRAIHEHRNDSLEDTQVALQASYTTLATTLANLKDDDLAHIGYHPKYGEKTLEWCIEEFVTGHLVAHTQQIQQCLQK